MEDEKYLIKKHESYRMVIAICDKELYGQKLEEGEKQLDLTGQFFNGEEVGKEELKQMIINYVKEDATFNIAGNNSCQIAKDMGIIGEAGINKISETPYALVLL